jgi:hypothetical protein
LPRSHSDISGLAVALASKSDHEKFKFCQFWDKSVELLPLMGTELLPVELGVLLVSEPLVVMFMSEPESVPEELPDVELSMVELEPEPDPDED